MFDMTRNLRPVVALDVDGVLNFDNAPDLHTLTVPAADQPKSPFVRGGRGEPVTITVRIDPSIGPWITELRKHAEVVWATTWQDMANKYLAPLLGIEPLPVGISIEANPPRFGHVKDGNSAGWKAMALTDTFAGRPLAWIDDQAWAYLPERTEDVFVPGQPWIDWRYTEDDQPAAPTLVLVPNESTGLTLAHRAQIEAFVANPYEYEIPRPHALDDSPRSYLNLD